MCSQARCGLAALIGDTVDINPGLKSTYVDDAQLLKYVPLEQYDLVLANRPLSLEGADRCETAMMKRSAVMRALWRLPEGGHMVWLDQVWPMYRTDAFAQEAVIGIWKSTKRRFRGVAIFCRLGAPKLIEALWFGAARRRSIRRQMFLPPDARGDAGLRG
jgi:hypothetical protein